MSDAGIASDGAPDASAPGDGDAEVVEPPYTNPFVDTADDTLSTFSIDPDTASYTMARAMLNAGQLPIPDRVRVEEFINFFEYGDPAPPVDAPLPFSVNLQAAPSRFGEDLHLLRIGIKGRLPNLERPAANLIFLVDVSGSMSGHLPLVKSALRTLVGTLNENDRIGLVTYAGNTRVVLPSTAVDERQTILNAIDDLNAGGSTAGGAGLRLAYEQADMYRLDGINRVILCTDGDFNVGITGDALVDEVASWRDRGVTLSVLGFGHPSYFNDAFLEELTNRGEGVYMFIDSADEADRAMNGAVMGLEFIAKDVKIQVEFDPEQVSRFRLLGYENRVLEHQDFRDDTVDAGEIPAGHYVTAFYEMALNPDIVLDGAATVRLRYKQPDGDESLEIAKVLTADAVAAEFNDASEDLRFGAAVIEFAEILRHSDYSEGADFEAVHAVAAASFDGAQAERVEFLTLVNRAASLWHDADL